MKRRDHYHVTPSERRRAWAAHERAKARVHKHVCEWCPADDVYTCIKSPCQHLKKKPCPSHKWNAKKGIAPERMDFTPPPKSVESVESVKFVEDPDEFVSMTVKISAEQMGKAMAASASKLISVDIETHVPGQKYPLIVVSAGKAII